MLKTPKTLHDVSSPSPTNRPSPCTTGDTAPYTYFLTVMTCGHRLAHLIISVLAWPNYLNGARACPARCSHMWSPDNVALQKHGQNGQQELECCNSSTKQPISNWYTRGLFGRRQLEVQWLLLLGPGAGHPWAQTSPGSSRGRKAAGQSRASSSGFCCSTNSTEIQLLFQEFFKTSYSHSMGQETSSTFERVAFHICPWLEHLMSCWTTHWI